MFLTLKNNFVDYFKDFFIAFKKNIFVISLFVCVLLNSGIGFVVFASSFKVKAMILLISFAILGLIFILTRDYSVFKNNKKSAIFSFLKQEFFSIDFFFIFIIFLLSGINFVIYFLAKKQGNINTIIGVLSTFALSFLIVRTYSKETFVKVFSNIVTVVSFTAIFFYALIFISRTNFNNSSFWSSIRSYDSYFYIFYDYTNSLYDGGTTRLMGVFWEPGLFANFILIGLIIELFYKNKTNIFKLILFIVALFLTKSTAGYFVFLIIVFAYIVKKFPKYHYPLMAFFLVTVVCLLIFYEPIFTFLSKIWPSVFGKMIGDNTSLITRLQSPLYFLKVFLRNPITGVGFDNSLSIYNSIVPKTIDSATSTYGYLIASLGLFGFVIVISMVLGLSQLFKNKNTLPVRILLLLCFIIIGNTEIQSQILGLSCFYFYGIKELSTQSLAHDSFSEQNQKCFLNATSNNKDKKSFANNISYSILLKGAAIIVGLLTIPVFSAFFGNDTVYGSWLTIVSILTLILSFDFGITDGLKNKIIKAQEEHDGLKIKKLISNSYIITLFVGGCFLLIGLPLIFTLNWNNMLNIPVSDVSESSLKISLCLILLTFSFEIILRNVVSVLSSYRKIALANSMMLISNSLLIIFALILKSINVDKIILLAALYFCFVNIPLLVSSFYAFRSLAKGMAPSFQCVDKKVAKTLLNIGIRFFIIQICNIFLWGINDVLISTLFSPAEVVIHQKYYKLFSTIISLFSIFQPTIWVYLAKYKENKNYQSIRKIVSLTFGLCLILVFGAILCGLCSQIIFNLWLGQSTITVTFKEVLPFVLYGVIYAFMCGVSVLCYAFEILKKFTIMSLIIIIIKIPLVILINRFAHNFGWSIVMWTNVILIIPYVALPGLELYKYYKKQKKGELINEK